MTRTARQKRMSRERAASKASRGKNCPCGAWHLSSKPGRRR